MLTSKIVKEGAKAKVLICGMKGVGKTTILEQLIYGQITPDIEIHSTIEDIYEAFIDCGKGGARDTLRIYDTHGIQGNAQLPRHYLAFPEAFILVYDPQDPSSLDILSSVKNDIDRNKEKKEVIIIVIANMRSRPHHHHTKSPPNSPQKKATPPVNPTGSSMDQVESILNRGNNWCAREKIKHFTVNAMERASLYEPFIWLASKLHPPQTKSSFPQLRQLTQKTSRADS